MFWQRFSTVAPLTLVVLVGCSPYGETQDKFKSLEKRVAELEKAQQESKERSQDRQAKLEAGIKQADQDYWNYMRINGKIKPDGTIWAPMYTWENARKQKETRLAELKLLYDK